MEQPVKLSEILDGMDFQSDDIHSYVDKKTGRVVSLSSEQLSRVEADKIEDGDLEDESDDDLEEDLDDVEADEDTRELLRDWNNRQDDLLALPSEYDIHEYSIMQEFAESLTNAKQADALLYAIRGSGAFRRFKDRIHELGIADQWYAYRAAALKKMAVDWCEENGLSYVDDRPEIGPRDGIETSGVKELYDGLVEQARALLGGERDSLANAANLAALLYRSLMDVNWVGWYFLREQELVLGPFQGKPACTRIPLGKGVCGTAAARREAIVVEDVHKFKGHIACDTASKSEIVIPVVRAGQLLGVLDLDSPLVGRFDADDRAGLERLVEVFLAASDDFHPCPSV
jgi:GAF domain-containing protein